MHYLFEMLTHGLPSGVREIGKSWTKKTTVEYPRKTNKQTTVQSKPAFFQRQSGYIKSGLIQNICMSHASDQDSIMPIRGLLMLNSVVAT